LYEPKEAPYASGDKNVCLRITEKWDRPIKHAHILNDLQKLIDSNVQADNISVHSAKTGDSNNGSVGNGRTTGSNAIKDRVESFRNSVMKKKRLMRLSRC